MPRFLSLWVGAILAIAACSTAESEPPTAVMPSGTVAIGEHARASIATDVVAADLRVPGSAVVTKRGQAFVFVKTGEATFAVRRVTTGRSENDRIAVVSGLAANEVIAVRGVLLLEAASEQLR